MATVNPLHIHGRLDMYVSYSNEIIDFFSQDIKKYEKNKHKKIDATGWEIDFFKKHIENTRGICNQIQSAVKFKVPACAQLLSADEAPLEELKNFVEFANLPFDSICIEMEAFALGRNQEYPCVVLARQDEEYIYIDVLIKVEGEWSLMANEVSAELISGQINKVTREGYMVGFNLTESNASRHGDIEHWMHDVPVRAVANLLCTLSCSNTHIEDSPEKPSKVKNDLRRQKKKLPFFEFKILTLESGKNSSQESGGGSGTHNSPRVHLRRGHIRRLPTKNVWVNACVVGDKTKGVIDKEYLVN